MTIKKKVLTCIYEETKSLKFETGGILGSSSNSLIDSIVIEHSPLDTPKACAYHPNTDFLNCKIVEWEKENISFMGMFHTHFAGVKTLSKGDINYINAIMKVMPDFIEFLYFPIYVLPDKKLICYRAIKEFDTVKICEETLHIVS